MAKREGTVFIEPDKCKGCSLCVVACPTGSLEIGTTLNRLGYHPVEFLPETGCTACGVCYYACPEPAALAVAFEKEDEAA
jgi:NAD-dependent dihydropyrimidine dehydrogenase PreA subunit